MPTTSKRISVFLRLLAPAFLLLAAVDVLPALPAAPAPAPGGSPNLLYGEVKAGAEQGKVLVFIHGLQGQPADWTFERAVAPNDMYELAYNAGYRTVFIGMSADNSQNSEGIVANRTVLENLLPEAAAELGASEMIMVAHSKGAVDLQAAMANSPQILNLVKEVYAISPPNSGSELANWAFQTPAGQILAGGAGLLTPGVFSLQTGSMELLRGFFDLFFRTAEKQFYVMAGDNPETNPLMAITGAILASLTGDEPNDGLVPLSRTKLPIEYGTDLGDLIDTNHFVTNFGNLTFPRINAQIQAQDNPTAFKSISDNGFGDFENSFAWSLGWFKGKLYVGTGRSFLCVTLATAEFASVSPIQLYPPADENVSCPEEPTDMPLRAEIWQYTPETKTWKRVYQAPEDVPVMVNGQQKLIARDIAYRGMAVHVEQDNTEALYVGGVNAGSFATFYEPYASGTPYPAPRILRTTDGENWAPVPMNPGTFLDNIGQEAGTIKARGWRSLTSHNGRLFATATDFIGVGRLAYADSPELGDNNWQWGTELADDFPVWTLLPFNGNLYMTTGDRLDPEGYGVYRTDGAGQGLLTRTPVVTGGAGQAQGFNSAYALSLAEFNGALYVGTDRPTELIRIFTDDSWQLLTGSPRLTPGGEIRPLSGMGTGFGNFFNGHFWRMASTSSKLFLTTWDWTVQLTQFGGANTYTEPMRGFDAYRTMDGIEWHAETRKGFGDEFNYGGRTQLYTPFGLVIGTANPFSAQGGTEIFMLPNADFDENGVVDGQDLAHMQAGLGQAASGPKDPRDFDGDGTITILDLRKFITQCTAPRCGASAALSDIDSRIPAPTELFSVPGSVAAGAPVMLSWQPSPNAVRYHIFRNKFGALSDIVTPGNQSGTTIPGPIVIDGISSDVFDPLCEQFGSPELCAMANAETTAPLIPGPPVWVGSTTGTTFTDDTLPPAFQSIYYVKAEDENGKLSDFSNIVGGPSLAPPSTFGSLRNELYVAAKPDSQRLPEWVAFVDRAEKLAIDGRFAESQAELEKLQEAVASPEDMTTMAAHADLQFLAKQLPRNLEFVEVGLLSIDALTERPELDRLTELHPAPLR